MGHTVSPSSCSRIIRMEPKESWRLKGDRWRKELFFSVWEEQERLMWSFHKPLNRLVSLQLRKSAISD